MFPTIFDYCRSGNFYQIAPGEVYRTRVASVTSMTKKMRARLFKALDELGLTVSEAVSYAVGNYPESRRFKELTDALSDYPVKTVA